MPQREIELLAPARDAETGRQAILHGADAVYIGPAAFGARKSAGNSVADIAALCDFAHIYRARVYATVNTIVYDRELADVERLCRELYEAGVDALIVQDMGLLRLNLPPIELHASTQCDTRTPEKAHFLQEAGFSQIVLARELTLKEIKEICSNVSVPVECFVHGALCVSYSGRCHASYACTGRSANRGECSQICRLPYTLTDGKGKVLERDRYLLSLRDFNASERIGDMLRAGVSSFKIEGRLKDTAYVKNITAYYRQLLDKEIASYPDLYTRSSGGRSEISFTPDPAKSFNRGMTQYFLDNPREREVWQPLTPKSLGQPVTPDMLHNGDGISWFAPDGTFTGALVNGVGRDGTVKTSSNKKLPRGINLYRTNDMEWERTLARPTAVRTLAVDMEIDATGVSARDERGVYVRVPYELPADKARKTFDPKPLLGKLGGTEFRLGNLVNRLPEDAFIPASMLADVRRQVVSALRNANLATLPLHLRRKENRECSYPYAALTFADNVSNSAARKFYEEHGVKEIAPALETQSAHVPSGTVVMTTRHCILRSLGLCLRETPKSKQVADPLTITSGKNRFHLDFDCSRCEMRVVKD